MLVEILDKDGNLCPWAENEVTFEVTGAGRNEGVDNGSPISLERFKSDKRKAFYGKAMLIVRNDGTQGPITVRATSPNLAPFTTTINAFELGFLVVSCQLSVLSWQLQVDSFDILNKERPFQHHNSPSNSATAQYHQQHQACN